MHRYFQQIVTGFETLTVGIFLGLQPAFYHDDPKDRFVHILSQMSDPYWSIFLIIVGVVTIIFGFIRGRNLIHQLLNILLGACWMSYLVFFFIQDTHFGPAIHLGTILAAYVLVRIFVDAYVSGKRSR